MSLETQLQENTAAIIALTAAILKQNTGIKADTVVGSVTDAPVSAPVTQTAPAKKVEPTSPVMTEKAGGATYPSFIEGGWTDEAMINGGYMTLGEATEVLTADQLNTVLVAKAGEMGDQGAAISNILQTSFGGRGVSQLLPAEMISLRDQVSVLVAGA